MACSLCVVIVSVLVLTKCGFVNSVSICTNSQPIGVQNSSIISDSSMTASSYLDLTVHGELALKPHYGRLHGQYGWIAGNVVGRNECLQIDLGSAHVICGVATQGSGPGINRTSYVWKYKLRYSMDNKTWTTYQEKRNEKVFQGNNDSHTVVKQNIAEPVRARFVRFVPTEYEGFAVLRVEVYISCKAPDCSPTLKSTQAISSTIIRVNWLPLTKEHCRIIGVIKGYKVAYKLNNSDNVLSYQDVKGVDNTETVVTGLDKYTEYSFQVLAYNVKDSPLSEAKVQRTKEDVPQSILNVTLEAVSSQSFQINWTDPAQGLINGQLTGYTIAYTAQEGRPSLNVDVGVVNTWVLTSLEKYTWYTVTVSVRNTKYVGPPSKEIKIRTMEDVPDGPPQCLSFSKTNATSYNVTWSDVMKNLTNGVVLKYELKWTLVRVRGLQIYNYTLYATSKILWYTFHDLQFNCSQYSVSVRAWTSKGPGPYSQSLTISTQRPDAPRNLNLFNLSSYSMELSWDTPILSNIQVFNITYTILISGSKNYWSNFQHTFNYTSVKRTSQVVSGLVPGTRYQVSVYATTVCGDSEHITTNTDTMIDAPLSVNVSRVEYLNNTGSVVNITILRVKPYHGPISAYQVIVVRGTGKISSRFTKTLFNYTTAVQRRLSYYITAEIPAHWNERSLTIGDARVYKNQYTNEPLQEGQRYGIYQRALTYHKGVRF